MTFRKDDLFLRQNILAFRIRELSMAQPALIIGYMAVCGARCINRRYQFADLMRELDIYCHMDFMTVSSYGKSTTSTGVVKITKDLSYNIENRDVVLVEDILDSGLTLAYLINYLSMRNPASIKICTLLDKPSRRRTGVVADYVGFICPDEFIVGYGLDYGEKYRNLPYIGVLKEYIYS